MNDNPGLARGALPVFGTKIIQVKPGTVVTGKDGSKHTVTDEQFAHEGDTIYVTPKTYRQIKKKVPIKK